MTVKKYNISRPEKYEKDGETKTKWNTVGTYIEFEKDGKISRAVEIPAINLRAQVFEIKPRE